LIQPDNSTILKLFPWQKQKEFFTPEEKERIVEAIRSAEQRTSGEVRVYVETNCRFVDPLDRAKEIFFQLKMTETKLKNAVLVYIATDDKQVAVFGDEGIHQKVGAEYWNGVLAKMLSHFKQEHVAGGLQQCIAEIGEALYLHFPYNKDTDKNELPDDIVFGK
jgi:uncharacterized membrane protein